MNTIWLLICRLFQIAFLFVIFFGITMLMIPTVGIIIGVLKRLLA